MQIRAELASVSAHNKRLKSAFINPAGTSFPVGTLLGYLAGSMMEKNITGVREQSHARRGD